VPSVAVQVPLSIAAMFDKRLNNDRVYGVSPLCSFLTLLTGGYFCTESLMICRNFEEHGVEPLAHAVVCVAFFILVAYTKKMQWFVPRVLFFECSTPLVHFRWLLASMGLADTTLYKVNGISMMAAFFVCRVVWGTSTLHPDPAILCLTCLFFTLLLTCDLFGTEATVMVLWLIPCECVVIPGIVVAFVSAMASRESSCRVSYTLSSPPAHVVEVPGCAQHSLCCAST
jgi:hypothetical protein